MVGGEEEDDTKHRVLYPELMNNLMNPIAAAKLTIGCLLKSYNHTTNDLPEEHIYRYAVYKSVRTIKEVGNPNVRLNDLVWAFCQGHIIIDESQ